MLLSQGEVRPGMRQAQHFGTKPSESAFLDWVLEWPLDPKRLDLLEWETVPSSGLTPPAGGAVCT